MKLQTLRVQNFRSYQDASFEFGEGVNIIVGPNGSGKTNLLEALLILAQGSSYRGSDADLVQYDRPWSRLDGYDQKGQRVVKLVRQEPAGGQLASKIVIKDFIIHGLPFKRLSFKQRLPITLFEPNHLRLLTGSPELRRDLIDNLLEQTEPGYGQLRRRYLRTLAQRNALLKSTSESSGVNDQFFAWNIRLSDLGGQIAHQRQTLIATINKKATVIYRKLSHNPKSKLQLFYRSNIQIDQYGSSFLKILEDQQHLDIIRGFTGSGPHRDDIVIELNSQPAATSASRGETRSIALTLKIMELTLLEAALGQKPILLLDDVFSELDGGRRRALTTAIAGYQTFITTTDADIVVQHFMNDCTIIPLSMDNSG